MKKIQKAYRVVALVLMVFIVLTLVACQPNHPNGNNGDGTGGGTTTTTYTVTFDANGGRFSNGAEQQTKQVKSGNKVTAPRNPARDNYTFKGWSRSRTGTTLWQFDWDTVTQNITLYAQWEQSGPKGYQLTVVANIPEAGVVEGGGTYASGSTVTLAAKTNLGYEFMGWYKGDTQVSSSSQCEISMPGIDSTYTAKFELLEEMKNFEFVSSPNYCLINGVVDSSVTEIVVPNFVTLMQVGALKQCTNLQSLTLPFVGSHADGTGRTKFGHIFGATVYDLEQYQFIPTTLKSVVITGGKTIGFGAFEGCYNITSIKIPKSVTSIGGQAFNECSNLKTVIFEDNSQLKSIGEYAFSDCRSLTSITLPRGVTSIDRLAFNNCSSLSRIVIPSSVTSMGNYVFDDCNRLYIYCEAANRPSGWDSTWSAGCPVTWNYNSNG